MPTVSSTQDHRETILAATRDRRLGALLAAALGIVILFGAGFAPGVAHNAAHDTRHSAAFPCH